MHHKKKPISKFKTDTFDQFLNRTSVLKHLIFSVGHFFFIDIHQSKYDIVHDIPIYLIDIAQVMDDGNLLVDDVIQYTYIYIFNLPTYLVPTWIRARKFDFIY